MSPAFRVEELLVYIDWETGMDIEPIRGVLTIPPGNPPQVLRARARLTGMEGRAIHAALQVLRDGAVIAQAVAAYHSPPLVDTALMWFQLREVELRSSGHYEFLLYAETDRGESADAQRQIEVQLT